MKRITDMSVTEYRRLARRMDKRFGPDKAWDQLPLARKLIPGGMTIPKITILSSRLEFRRRV